MGRDKTQTVLGVCVSRSERHYITLSEGPLFVFCIVDERHYKEPG